MKLIFSLLIFCICFRIAPVYAQGVMATEQLPPDIQTAAEQLSRQVAAHLAKIDWSHVPASVTSGTAIFTVPVVVHVLHNYGTVLVPDSQVCNLVNTITGYFLKTNADTVNIINKYKAVAANTQIAFKLATVAPDGSATRGIEHIYSYLTAASYLDQAKIHQWPQDRYLNVWLVSSSASYGYSSLLAAYYPYYDGIVITASTLASPTGTLAKEFARYLNLPSPCSYGGGCGDGDGIPDTPPCDNSLFYTCSDIYTAPCDTPNIQNIMINRDVCALMFTYGQAAYMQYILQIDIGKRDSLITTSNFARTGMGNAMPDLPPVADFSVNTSFNRFFYPGKNITFRNRSWNDTIINAAWTFGAGASVATSSSLTSVNNKFYKPGWVTVSLTVDGNNTGSNTLTDSNALYIADTTAMAAASCFQEFTPGSTDKWPVFNYYHNNFRWQPASTGYWDNNCMMYSSFDDRPFPENRTGGPAGDMDDFFSPAVNLTGFGDSCFLNFEISGATRTANPHFMHDVLEVSYSTDKAQTWHIIRNITGNELANKGVITIPYAPASANDWKPVAISLPSVARQPSTVFRFRYYPGADSTGISSGNNFYLDRIHFNEWPEAVGDIAEKNIGIIVAPNPTNAAATVYLHSLPIGEAIAIDINDITGKSVYATSHIIGKQSEQLLIPREAISTKGIYIVRIKMQERVFFQRLTVF